MTFGPDFTGVPPVPFAALVRQDGKPPEGGKSPTTGRRAFLSRVNHRRFACLQAAAEAAEIIPAEGEAVHVVMSGCYDLQHVLIVLLGRLGCPCSTMRVATLSLSRRNVMEMAALIDGGTVRRIDLLTSDFFAKHDDDIFAELVQEFQARGQRVAAARSHCKVVTMELEDQRKFGDFLTGGRGRGVRRGHFAWPSCAYPPQQRLAMKSVALRAWPAVHSGNCPHLPAAPEKVPKFVLHGSPNLRTNKNMEQFALERSAALHAHYDAFLDAMVTAHEVKQNDGAPTG
jgi:hypothetical protein